MQSNIAPNTNIYTDKSITQPARFVTHFLAGKAKQIRRKFANISAFLSNSGGFLCEKAGVENQIPKGALE